jgi:ribonuclease P protein component
MNSYAKKNISTEQSQASEETRISQKNVNESGTQCFSTSPQERTQKINAVSLLNFRLPKDKRLRKPKEFRRVYAEGVRFKGRFMTAFLMPSETSFQRIGITASKRAVGNAVARNRAKRLLRETFRLSKVELNQLENKYDWVLNARRNLLEIKMQLALEDFRQIIEKVKQSEARKELNKGEESVV